MWLWKKYISIAKGGNKQSLLTEWASALPPKSIRSARINLTAEWPTNKKFHVGLELGSLQGQSAWVLGQLANRLTWFRSNTQSTKEGIYSLVHNVHRSEQTYFHLQIIYSPEVLCEYPFPSLSFMMPYLKTRLELWTRLWGSATWWLGHDTPAWMVRNGFWMYFHRSVFSTEGLNRIHIHINTYTYKLNSDHKSYSKFDYILSWFFLGWIHFRVSSMPVQWVLTIIWSCLVKTAGAKVHN